MTVLSCFHSVPKHPKRWEAGRPENSMTVAMREQRISVPYLLQVTEHTKQDSDRLAWFRGRHHCHHPLPPASGEAPEQESQALLNLGWMEWFLPLLTYLGCGEVLPLGYSFILQIFIGHLYVLGTVLGSGNRALHKVDQNPSPPGAQSGESG